MHILITGGTGFIGSYLTKHFLEKNYSVTILSRNKHNQCHGAIVINNLKDIANPVNIIINLAGYPLDKKRWDKKVKKDIYESRISTTRKIVEYINNAKKSPSLFITGSAIGYYGVSNDKTFSESDISPKNDFPSKLCYDWEHEAYNISKKIRICRVRLGIVLGKKGGIFDKMLIPFKLHLGTTLGSGNQYMSWIHIEDVKRIVDLMINNESISGPVNLTAPYPITNKDFTQILAKSLEKFSFLHLPGFVVKILFGEMGKTLLLQGQKVMPKKLLDLGFKFKYSTIEAALKSLVTK